jgi:hypothetical protein
MLNKFFGGDVLSGFMIVVAFLFMGSLAFNVYAQSVEDQIVQENLVTPNLPPITDARVRNLLATSTFESLEYRDSVVRGIQRDELLAQKLDQIILLLIQIRNK